MTSRATRTSSASTRSSFPQAIDAAGELYTHFGVPGQPAWVFVDRAGKVTRNLGAMEPEDLTAALDRILTA